MEFKCNVQRIDKAYNKENEVSQVKQMYASVTRDTLQEYTDSKIDMETCFERLKDVSNYANRSYRHLNNSFGHKVFYTIF